MRLLLAALFIISFLPGCITPGADRDALEMSIKQYNRMLQRQEMEQAALFVAEQNINDFSARAKASKGVKIADHRITVTRYDELMKEADVRVEMDYYHNTSFRLKTFVDVQKWKYVTEGGSSQWKLLSRFPEFP